MIIVNVWNMYMMYVQGGGSIGNPLSSLVDPMRAVVGRGLAN